MNGIVGTIKSCKKKHESVTAHCCCNFRDFLYDIKSNSTYFFYEHLVNLVTIWFLSWFAYEPCL